jgi:hypothetical protein
MQYKTFPILAILMKGNIWGNNSYMVIYVIDNFLKEGSIHVQHVEFKQPGNDSFSRS